jgi:hypothetical protein
MADVRYGDFSLLWIFRVTDQLDRISFTRISGYPADQVSGILGVKSVEFHASTSGLAPGAWPRDHMAVEALVAGRYMASEQ